MTNIKAAALAASCFCSLLAAPAQAEETAKWFINQADQGSTTAILVLTSYENGMAWSNAYLEDRGEAKLYCTPAKLALTYDQIVDILRRYVAKYPKVGEEPAGLTLLYAMIDAFPCPGNT